MQGIGKRDHDLSTGNYKSVGYWIDGELQGEGLREYEENPYGKENDDPYGN